MSRTIRVTGTGKLLVKPDLIRFTIRQEETYDSYEEAIEASARNKAAFESEMKKIGISPDKLKTVYFNISPKYESYQERMIWKQKQVGFNYNHNIKLEIPMADNMLGKVLEAIQRCPGGSNLNIEYTVADPGAKKNLLLENAVKDSVEKAKVIAAAAGVTLGMVMEINYSWGELDIVSRPFGDMAFRANKTFMAPQAAQTSEAANMTMESDDIEISDTVTVVWEIGC